MAADANPEGLVPEELPTVVVDDAPAPPLGRSWAFDFGAERMQRSRGVPLETRGVQTLVSWIDKCLHTARGAMPIHPPEYGLVDPMRFFGRPVEDVSAQELEEAIRDALTFHPRIADVTGLRLRSDPQSSAVFVQYQIVTDPPTDDAELLTIRTSLETAA